MMAGNFTEEGIFLCSGHSACRSVFSNSLSTAALHLSAGGSMFNRTGNHGSSAEHRAEVPYPVITSFVSASVPHAPVYLQCTGAVCMTWS